MSAECPKCELDLLYKEDGTFFCPVCECESCAALRARIAALEKVAEKNKLGVDSDSQVFFYERDFYCFSNFSAFRLVWDGLLFDTSEAAYHWEKFPHNQVVQNAIRCAPSAHAALKIAENYRTEMRDNWLDIRVDVMRKILLAKVSQHEYVRRKLIQTGNRELIEDSWRDAFWGWGSKRDGKNMLGKLWMEVRAALKEVGK